ncbi:MAG: hypothetical protein AUK47_19145 [Deltaproteobacteria bacterium CG2_30_63_29]|nr:MAG: hypothetical protein AUK47_19145 [Deltaproteobacteria bacterium CG2_30_63_29]PIV98725.1 MAG: hypothetical protein COW42_13405 [Deltaproteobacteria bacterium CG17_big_fil_post_rev_8_21_14_2_50_63_7]PJB38953.1 MAG: hypothetical protein CO108_18100 [Deltaproteobacteria bacterium CG_4_9_14_3_um_filter_63_12]
MSGRFTHRHLEWVLEELQVRLREARLRKVMDLGVERTVLVLRTHAGDVILSLWTSAFSRLYLLDEKPLAPASPKAFTQLLRKHLVGARLVAIEQQPADRLLRLVWERGGEFKTLVVDLIPGRAHLALVGADSIVLGVNRGTANVVGEPFCGPPPSGSPTLAEPEDLDWKAPLEGRSAVLRERLERQDTEFDANRLRIELRRRLRTAIKKTDRLTAQLQTDLDKAAQAERFKHEAELMQANYWRLTRGQSEVIVEDYGDNMRLVAIPLEPALSPQENVARRFKAYKRFARALDAIRQRLEAAQQRGRDLGALLAEISAVNDGSDESWLQRAEALGVRLPQGSTPKAANAPALPYRVFRSMRGFEIRVGKSAKANDALTFKYSRGNDLWLHASGWPGSHVTVPSDTGHEVERETLIDAAMLAAHYCRGRKDTTIEVLYTQQKYVRRAKGAAAGKVLPSQCRTLAIRIDDARIKRLLESSPHEAR